MNFLRPISIFIFSGLIFFGLNAQNVTPKRYHVKAAEIIYKTKSSEGEGTKTLKFDNYGMRETVREIVKNNGKIIRDDMTIINYGKGYSINLLANTGRDISERLNTAMTMADSDNGDYSVMGEKMLEKMGGKKIGTETFLGKECDKWELSMMGKTTLLIWNGVPLCSDANIMGMKVTEEAKSVDTDVSFSDSDFIPPEGVAIKKNESEYSQFNSSDDTEMDMQEMKENMEKMKNMTFEEFKKMVKQEEPEATDEEIKQIYDMMKKAAEIYK